MLAGVRILSASSAAELRGRTAKDLGNLQAPLSLLTEVRGQVAVSLATDNWPHG